MQYYATNGYTEFEITEEQNRTYNALRIAAERIGQNNYANGTYQPPSKYGRHITYSITAEHEALIDAMPKVLNGSLSCESAMALLWQYDTMKQRYNK